MENLRLFSVETILFLTTALVGYIFLTRKKVSQTVGHVTDLYIYPLKSGRGNSLKSAMATETGLMDNGLHDRSIAVRRLKSNLKISGREAPKLTQITTEKVQDDIILRAPGIEMLKLKAPRDKSATVVEIFGTKVQCFDAGDEAAEWITRYLSIPSRMSILPQSRTLRNGDHSDFERNWRLHGLPKDLDNTGFSDGYPYLLLSDDSLRDINERIPGKNYTHRTFRPNITIKNEDGKPWSEDNFVGQLQIGEAIFAVASPCPRCVFTTVDPETGSRGTDGEPLRTLRKTRLANGKDQVFTDAYRDSPLVGMNVVIIKEGEIRLGDAVILKPK